jgi:hypothetical protein
VFSSFFRIPDDEKIKKKTVILSEISLCLMFFISTPMYVSYDSQKTVIISLKNNYPIFPHNGEAGSSL